jgi:hypothetical protein
MAVHPSAWRACICDYKCLLVPADTRHLLAKMTTSASCSLKLERVDTALIRQNGTSHIQVIRDFVSFNRGFIAGAPFRTKQRTLLNIF